MRRRSRRTPPRRHRARCVSAATRLAATGARPPRPERPDERQPRQRRPLLTQVDLQQARAPRDRGTAPGSPMTSAASHRASIAQIAGGIGTNSGSMPNALGTEHPQQRRSTSGSWCRPRSTDRADRLGAEERDRRHRPIRDDAHAGTMRYGPTPRRNSIDGIMPTSIEPSCSSAAHLRRRIEPQREEIAARSRPVDERARVQVVDRAQTNDGASG